MISVSEEPINTQEDIILIQSSVCQKPEVSRELKKTVVKTFVNGK